MLEGAKMHLLAGLLLDNGYAIAISSSLQIVVGLEMDYIRYT